HQVSGAHDSFLWQKHNRIALRVASPEKKKLDFALAPKERHFRRIRHSGRGWLERFELLQIRLRRGKLLFKCGSLSGILCLAQLFLERLNLSRHVRDGRLERLP